MNQDMIKTPPSHSFIRRYGALSVWQAKVDYTSVKEADTSVLVVL